MRSAAKWRYFATVVLNSYSVASFGSTADAGSATGMLYSLLTSLILILGAAAAAAFILRRWKGAVGRRDGPLRLEHVIALGPREWLALVRVGTLYLVVGVTPTTISKVAELSGPLEGSPKQTAETFVETEPRVP